MGYCIRSTLVDLSLFGSIKLRKLVSSGFLYFALFGYSYNRTSIYIYMDIVNFCCN